MIRGVIIEGMSTAGKTSTFAAIKQVHSHLPNAERTTVAISEHYSQVLHSHHGSLRKMAREDHLQFLGRHVDYLEQQAEWIHSLGNTKVSNGTFFLLERFHLNHRAAFQDDREIEKLEKRLTRLNALCVLLTLSEDIVESRYLDSRGEHWKAYVMQNHRTAAEACQTFLKEQERLRQGAKLSPIPTLEINTDGADWEGYANRILSRSQ
ncbi:hypothetical protein MJA45_14155 [Paenibacillus aurantius]|uniref:Uncharacterized protein n=1 Tax=Paenibacillus aurantius TaxID=2918900 RepID=A0AA96RI05_9BACL|nr:hypothetical protein [Paenibacillus aurantius]WNQ14111.1 hypothetical protein MJA45_14155 [Paenibacillus aurantius]